MPGTKSVKRHQKKKRKELRRRKRQKQDAVRKDQWKRGSRFPKFKVASGCTAAPEFTDAVYSAAQKVNFEDTKFFDSLDKKTWNCVAHCGFHTFETLCEIVNEERAEFNPNAGDAWLQEEQNRLSQAIYSLIPESIKNRFMPHNYFIIQPKDKIIFLNCQRVISQKTLQGNIHFGLNTPSLEVAEGTKHLVFTTHALERVCERIAPRWRTHVSDLMDIVRFVAYVPRVELTTLHDNQPAVVLFRACGSSIYFTHEVYVEGILGEQNYDSDDDCFEYRLGYCPIEYDGQYVVAKTFLPPGYNGTPEHGLLLNCKLPKTDKNKMLSLVKNHVRDNERAEEWLPLVKWFHENGVPQVRQRGQNNQEIHKSRFVEMGSLLNPTARSWRDE
ncbi:MULTISPECIES: hypothetical protein [Gimesia]|uniref:Uncharacterized protein n=1 Tax=Gimesia benthica TaxID=2608982 RepID=A0A6I6A7Q9_9PLAN|nr:hypothetical protein [Gimesia benthica]QGQ21940.1 hypothetical protein F1728_04205 [Gimesia benthica]|tara:strand:- start:47622 stop:48779 length:1158 start_codon:yes stop_codon:yes gene_type:complete